MEKDLIISCINEYFQMNYYVVIQNLLEKLNCSSLQELKEKEHNLQFGFDCGWVNITENNQQFISEFEIDLPINTQSTTIKKALLEKAIENINYSFDTNYELKVVLD